MTVEDPKKPQLKNQLDFLRGTTQGQLPAKADSLRNALLGIKTTTAVIAPPKRSDIAGIQKTVLAVSTTAKASHSTGICFLIDATASRSQTWSDAQKIQAKLFDQFSKASNNLTLGIVCHRASTVEPLGWFKDARAAKSAMAEIVCWAGSTRIAPGLAACMTGNGADITRPSSIIMVGDCCEENIENMRNAYMAVGGAGTRIFAFLEKTSDTNGYAEEMYRMAAELTGGAFHYFGDEIDLSSLCEAVVAFDMGGIEALHKLLTAGHRGAKALSGQLEMKSLSYKPPAP